MGEEINRKPEISVVTPVYRCADCLEKLYQRLVTTLEQISPDFEIIMVNDASPDQAWKGISELCQKDKRVKGINFSRNFGQHHAIAAGLDHTRGDWVVVIDCDLQDQPEEILKLHNKAKEGFEVVFGSREYRQDSFFKKLGSATFNRVLSYFTDQKLDRQTGTFLIMSEKVVREFRKLQEKSRSFSLLIFWLGFSYAKIPVQHANRPIGKSSYRLMKLAYLASDVIIAHSNKPLRLSISLGFIMSIASLSYGAYLVVRYLAFDIPVAGWTSVMVSIFLVGGMLFANMGILGLYIGKIFNEIKDRPIYVVESKLNLDINEDY